MKIKEIIERQANNENVAIGFKDKEVTYRELHQIAKIHSEEIVNSKCNRNVGIFFSNSIDYAIGYFSVAYADKIIIPIEDNAKSNMIKSVISYCEISLVITNSSFLSTLKEYLSDYDHRVDIYNIETRIFESLGNGDYVLQGDEDEEDVAIMLHTSGTTSNPKRVMLTNKNLIANINSNVNSLGITQDDISLIVLPMFFGYCNSSQFLSHLYVGAKVVIYDGLFLPKKFLKLIETKKCTNTTCVPSMLFLIVKGCKREKYDISSLDFLCFGGGVMPIDMLEKVIQFFSGVRIIQTYGQTEAAPRVTCLLPENNEKKLGSVGKAIPGVKIELWNKDDQPVSVGEIGEIVVQGDNVMKGYYKNDEITKQTLRNGWLHTGDLGRFDEDGDLYIIGRIKNIIISGGLNIYPEEIEETLINNPKVKEVVVIGEECEILGEVPVAKIVLKDGYECSKEEIINYCLERLPSNKVPGKIIFCEELMKTYTGKVKRR